jgi:HAD superfamily hydrolase (TIGR01549 family)
MDGTLTISNIDYKTMRTSIDIPQGDLFTVMESWSDGERIKQSMDIILEIEATAAKTVQPMVGLLDLLYYLNSIKSTGVKVGLVTRNTTDSVNAFFSVIGEEWRAVFDIILTREHSHVKPDKRCLLYFSNQWTVPPFKLLMVGDSLEDIETGNAAGTATCLIAGGGNEVQVKTPPIGGSITTNTNISNAAAPSLSPGAVPTFSVDTLTELYNRLISRDTALGWGYYHSEGSISLSSTDSDNDTDNKYTTSSDISLMPGGPPLGLDWLDWLFTSGSVQGASCSFPRIDGARFGTPPDIHPGDKVVHLGCGVGALTKLLFSSGLHVVGAGEDSEALIRRGLPAIEFSSFNNGGGENNNKKNKNKNKSTSHGLEEAVGMLGGEVDAVVWRQEGKEGSEGEDGFYWNADVLKEVYKVLRKGGKVCYEYVVEGGGGREEERREKRRAVESAGFKVVDDDVVVVGRGGEVRARLIGVK